MLFAKVEKLFHIPKSCYRFKKTIVQTYIITSARHAKYDSVCNPSSSVESCLDALEQLCVAFIRAIGVPKDLSLSLLYSKSKNKCGTIPQHTFLASSAEMFFQN